jgi:hypothetical protein
MAKALGCHRNRLSEWKRYGYLSEGRHYRKVNPLAVRSNLVWHMARVLSKLGAL